MLLLHTIVLYGSELAVDLAIKLFRIVEKLVTYNSALIPHGLTLSTGGVDYGKEVREAAKVLAPILYSDFEIRAARNAAREGHDTLVPMGHVEKQSAAGGAPLLDFGQGMTAVRVGAGFGMEAIPGMYEGRPQR